MNSVINSVHQLDNSCHCGKLVVCSMALKNAQLLRLAKPYMTLAIDPGAEDITISHSQPSTTNSLLNCWSLPHSRVPVHARFTGHVRSRLSQGLLLRLDHLWHPFRHRSCDRSTSLAIINILEFISVASGHLWANKYHVPHFRVLTCGTTETIISQPGTVSRLSKIRLWDLQLVSAHPETYRPLDMFTELTEMTPNLLRVTDFPNFNGISVTNREAFNEQATSGIDKVTGIVPSLSPECSNPCHLPPELLAAIFLEYMQRYRGSLFYARVPPWVDVSYICRHWHSVALNCANLWTHLFFVSSKWMDELLRRLKTAPLIIHIDFYFSTSDAGKIFHCLQKALRHMECIWDLWVDCRSKDIFHIVHAGLTEAAPLLRSLHLSTFDGHKTHFIICKDTLPGACLQKLHLHLCHVDWLSSIFNRLTELSLSYVLNDAVERWDGLLLILSQLPLLRQLCLDNILPPANIDFEDSFINTQNTSKVLLCRLEKLTLTDPILWVMALLAQLEFPTFTIVWVECNCDNPEDISMFVLFMVDRFSSHLSLPQSTPSPQSPLRSLSVRCNDQLETTWTIMCSMSYPANTNRSNHISLEEERSRFQIPAPNCTHCNGQGSFLGWNHPISLRSSHNAPEHDHPI